MKQGAVTLKEYELLAQFRYDLRRFLHFSEEAAHSLGLSPQQHQAMLAIKGFSHKNPFSVGDLAEKLQIRHHSAVELLNRLLARGFALKKRNAKDRRAVSITLTKRGEKLLLKLTQTHKLELKDMAERMSELAKYLIKSSKTCS
jgi:DNA-binding MarR family transcriptional regulator